MFTMVIWFVEFSRGGGGNKISSEEIVYCILSVDIVASCQKVIKSDFQIFYVKNQQ